MWGSLAPFAQLSYTQWTSELFQHAASNCIMHCCEDNIHAGTPAPVAQLSGKAMDF